MRRLLSCAEASELDRLTRERAALPSLLLMEDASLRIWDALRPIAEDLGAGRPGSPLVALCGAGHNAGDALAVLRHASFAGLRDLAVILGREELGEPSSIYLGSLRELGVSLLSWEREAEACRELLGRASLLVDGIAGTGLAGALRGGLAELAKAANASGKPVAAVDLPSGLRDGLEPGDELVAADWTISVEPRKAALYAPAARPSAGRILAVEGVFPRAALDPLAPSATSASSRRPDTVPRPSAFLLEEADLASLLPADLPDRHKGQRGRVAAFAGAVGSTGAACLASKAALAAGAGLVSLFAAPEILEVLAARLDSVMVKPEPKDEGAIDASRYDAILAGPGWGPGDRNRAALGRLLSSGLPAVLDAQAIRLYAELLGSGFKSAGALIITPHPGEYAALTGVDPDRLLASPAGELRSRAAALGAVIVLKAQVTWIASPEGELAVWDGRESGLATAGSGDVLAGLAAGLLASMAAGLRASSNTRNPASEDDVSATSSLRAAAFAAAKAAVMAHGLAGRRVRESSGWFEAGELPAEAARLLGAREGAR